jgi:alkylation response protein AidB-like acyl-CoA dehydrogenase
MIDFELDPELALLQETTRGFAEDHLRPGERELEKARAIPESIARVFHEIGLWAVELPESLGGAALGALARTRVLEELAAVDVGAAVALDPLGPALYPLAELGGAEAPEALAGPLLGQPGRRAVLAWNGDDPAPVRIANGRASGSLPWVAADRVDLLVLLDRQGAVVIEDGIACEPVRGAGLRAAGASSLSLDSAPLRCTWSDPQAAARALARARLYVASLLVGVMRASAEYSRAYARERVAFGRPIAHHQALAFLIADMRSAVEGARLLLLEAAWRHDRGDDAVEASATAFVEAAEQALFVTPSGLQILGGHGFMQDYPVEKYMREARTLSLWLGGADAAREDAGRQLAATEPPVALTQVEH